ncbi:MAG: molecular chaperone DnaK, partial [Steroidobacteraceae bacterium]
GEERAKAEAALADLKSAMKGDDHDVIAKKTEALAQASASIAQKAYSGADGQAAAGGAAPGGSEAGAGASGAAGADNVVDAEFEEVSDKDKGRKAS